MHAPVVRSAAPLRRRAILMLVASLCASLQALTADAQNSRGREDRDRDQRVDSAFSWSGSVASGRRALIKNINGSIHVERSNSGRVEVSAVKRWRRGNPDDVRIEQKMTANGDVVVCALWTPESRCEESGIRSEGRHRNGNDQNDVSVRITLRVPDGVRVDLSTVNGELDIDGVTNEVRANTVNGGINAQNAVGTVRATTVNGSIHLSLGSVDRADDLEYETVNGSVTIELPANFGAQIDLSTVNGRVSTDLPITVSGTLSPRRLRGTVGNGSTRMRVSTVNGSITLRKRS